MRSDNSQVLALLDEDARKLDGAMHVSDSMSEWFGSTDVRTAVSDYLKSTQAESKEKLDAAKAGWTELHKVSSRGAVVDRFNPAVLNDHLVSKKFAEQHLGQDSVSTETLIRSLPQPRQFDQTPAVTIENLDYGPVTSFTLRVDEKNRPVGGLTEADFDFISTDGKTYHHFVVVPKAITSTKSAIAVLVDVSGSMNGRLQELVNAVAHFIDSCHPETRLMLMKFDHEFEVVVPFTTDRGRLRRALASLTPRGATDIHGALEKAISILSQEPGAKTVLLCTDGMDQTLPSKISGILANCSKSEISINTLGLNDPSLDRRSLQQLSNGTGGTSVVAENVARIADAMNQVIAQQNSSSYRIVVLTKDLGRGHLQLRLRGDRAGTQFAVQGTTKTDTRVGFDKRQDTTTNR
jgi:Mg-chelatase subunit ChlD